MKNKTKIVYKIGCSGFHYREWKGMFYPESLPPSKWFEYYCQHFDTLELNVTFYRTMKPDFFKKLYEKSPEHFKFSVKAPRIITHYKKFNGTQQLTNEFYELVHDGLKDKLGCVLFQLPPSLTYHIDQLQLIINNLNSKFNNVVEFRNTSWWNEEIYKSLGKQKICFCTVGYPGLPNQLITNTPLLYCRLHGSPKLYHSSYSKNFLQGLVTEMTEKNLSDIYIYFDNTASLAAIKNAVEMNKMMLKSFG